MRNDYAYIDPDHLYTNPNTGVLRNLADITERDALFFFESVSVTKRLKELKNNPLSIDDSNALFAIHKYLFQDVYTWAGQRRLVEINKGGKQFFPTSHFDNAFIYIDKLLVDYRAIDKRDKPLIAEKLAEILDAVNYLHPFREGNGRTQRAFIEYLARASGYHIDFSGVSDKEMIEASAEAFAMNYDKMTAMFKRILSPITADERQAFNKLLGFPKTPK
jgi:cell filamentation protein